MDRVCDPLIEKGVIRSQHVPGRNLGSVVSEWLEVITHIWAYLRLAGHSLSSFELILGFYMVHPLRV